MLIAIRYKKGDHLAPMLANIQPQLDETDDIYIIDTAEGKGLAIARHFNTKRSVIYVERGDYSLKESLKFFEERTKKNKHDGFLYLENVLLSATFMLNLERANLMSDFEILSPFTVPNGSPNFKWFNPPVVAVKMWNDYTLECSYFSRKGEGCGKFAETVLLI